MRVEYLEQVLVEHSSHARDKGIHMLMKSHVEHVIGEECDIHQSVLCSHLYVLASMHELNGLGLAKIVLIMAHVEAQIFHRRGIIILDLQQVVVHLLVNGLQIVHLVTLAHHFVQEKA